MSLKKSDVLDVIASEPEYPEIEKFHAEFVEAIKEFPGTSDHLARALTDMVIDVARKAVRRTKEKIIKNVQAMQSETK